MGIGNSRPVRKVRRDVASRPARRSAPRWLVRLAVAGTFACSDATSPDTSLAPPADLGDGWPVATPTSVALDPAALVMLAGRVEREEFGHVHALLVARRGALVFERYFQEYDATEPHTLQSVTKSVTSALVGIAVDRGEIASLDLTLGELFTEYADILDSDSVKAGIRIRDLLSMQSGMAWDESSYPFSDDRNDAGRLSRSADWIRTALEQPIEATPGTTWTYNSGASILLSGILLRLTGRDAAEYADEHLFGPMGFSDFVWFRNPVDGLPHTGGGLRLFPRDLARFGQLYLDGGVWSGRRLISGAWVEESRALRATVGQYGYGYQWWMKPLDGVTGHAPLRSDVLFGWGFGGQHVFVSDDLELVVAINGWNADGSSLGPQLFDALVRRAVRP